MIMTTLVGIIVVGGALATLAVIAGFAARNIGLKADREFSRLARPADLAALPRVTVIVPARNEERNIGPCLESILALDYPNIEVIVVDDHSSDRTTEIVRGFSAGHPGRAAPRLFFLAADPDATEIDWICRKSHALWFGARQARGEWILFLDADTRIKPDALWRAVSLAGRHGLRALSLSGTYINPGLWGSVLESTLDSAIFLSVSWWRINDSSRPTAWMNGNFILYERSMYFEVGGHRAIARFIQDDLSLALLSKKRRVPFLFLPVSSAYESRDYIGLGEAFRGWTRRLAAGGVRLHLGRLSYFLQAGVLFLVGLAPVLVAAADALGVLGDRRVFGLRPGAWALAQIGSVMIIQGAVRRAMKMTVWPGLFASVGAALGISVVVSAYLARFVKKTVDLRGRSLNVNDDGE